MSTIVELTPWQKFYSHIVNCNKCVRIGSKLDKPCPVAVILLREAKKEPEESHKPKSFPFVPRINERILCHIKRDWVEAIVIEKSIQPAEMYERTDWETGETQWRTAASKTIGYEVMTDDKERHYVRPYEIKSMRPKKLSGSSMVEQVPVKHSVAGSNPAPAANSDLIIRRGLA